MRDIIYKLADGRLWQASRGEFIANPVMTAADGPGDGQSAGQDAAAPQDGADAMIIDLASAEGRSDETYLAETLESLNLPLGEMVWISITGLKRELEKLDTEYLTPRTLAGLAVQDAYALEKWKEHEEKAAPLRERINELQEEGGGGQ